MLLKIPCTNVHTPCLVYILCYEARLIVFSQEYHFYFLNILRYRFYVLKTPIPVVSFVLLSFGLSFYGSGSVFLGLGFPLISWNRWVREGGMADYSTLVPQRSRRDESQRYYTFVRYPERYFEEP